MSHTMLKGTGNCPGNCPGGGENIPGDYVQRGMSGSRSRRSSNNELLIDA